MICVRCGALPDANAEGWRGCRLAEDGDSPHELAFYCPACAAREFGPFAIDFARRK